MEINNLKNHRRRIGTAMAKDQTSSGSPVVYWSVGSLSNDNGDGIENVTNLHIYWAKTIALHAPHVRFSLLSISLPSSAKQQRERAKFEVL